MEFTRTSYLNHVEILAIAEPYVAVPVMLDSTDAVIAALVADAAGRKILPAGTPLGGAFKTDITAKATVQNDADAVAVLLHDTDVTAGDTPGAAVIWGFVSKTKITANGTALAATAVTALQAAGVQVLY